MQCLKILAFFILEVDHYLTSLLAGRIGTRTRHKWCSAYFRI